MYDVPSGLYFHGSGRQSDNANDNFIESDAPGYGNKADPLSLNMYLLDGANPISMRDPSGHDFTAETLAVATLSTYLLSSLFSPNVANAPTIGGATYAPDGFGPGTAILSAVGGGLFVGAWGALIRPLLEDAGIIAPKALSNIVAEVGDQSGLTGGMLTRAAADEAVELGTGRAFTHFTDLQGASGITGVPANSLQSMAVGERYVLQGQIVFKGGSNTFLAANPGDIFVTELPADAGSGALNQIGVFGAKQQFAITFSEESAYNAGARVLGAIPSRSIYTVPGNSTIPGTFILQRRF